MNRTFDRFTSCLTICTFIILGACSQRGNVVKNSNITTANSHNKWVKIALIV